MIYSHCCVPEDVWQFYLAEGEPASADYIYFELPRMSEDEDDWAWAELRLSDLPRVPDLKFDGSSCRDTLPDEVPHSHME
jgi:hypothetical protein